METVISNKQNILEEAGFGIMGHELSVKLRTGINNDSYAFEMTSPIGAGIALHKLTGEDEVMYILEGEFEIASGDETFSAVAGDCISFPRNTPHGYKNIGVTEAKTLWIVTPGKNLEQCFNELSTYSPEKNTNAEIIAALGAKHGIEFC